MTQGSSFQVGDHDFTVFSLIPSVCLLVDFPTSVESSWYTGQVLVGLKEAAFEASSPQRHGTELRDILMRNGLHTQPILSVSRIRHVSHTFLVQLNLTLLLAQISSIRLCPATIICTLSILALGGNPLQECLLSQHRLERSRLTRVGS